MPRKEQGWITFQTSDEERQILEEICQASQRTKTEVLRELLRNLKQDASATVAPLPTQEVAEKTAPLPEVKKKPLKVSSRNVLKGRITKVLNGAVNSEVTIEITHSVELISIITKTSAEELELAEGKEAYAVIKSSDVVIALE
jgi:molybdopterin-binding protein